MKHSVFGQWKAWIMTLKGWIQNTRSCNGWHFAWLDHVPEQKVTEFNAICAYSSDYGYFSVLYTSAVWVGVVMSIYV